MNKKTLVIDLDHTICIPNLKETEIRKRYGEAIPIHSVIHRLTRLSKNFKIIIHTARGMISQKGDVQKILDSEIPKYTREWLEKYNVPFDDLIFGKPYSDTYYIDDKSMSIEEFLDEGIPW